MSRIWLWMNHKRQQRQSPLPSIRLSSSSVANLIPWGSYFGINSTLSKKDTKVPSRAWRFVTIKLHKTVLGVLGWIPASRSQLYYRNSTAAHLESLDPKHPRAWKRTSRLTSNKDLARSHPPGVDLTCRRYLSLVDNSTHSHSFRIQLCCCWSIAIYLHFDQEHPTFVFWENIRCTLLWTIFLYWFLLLSNNHCILFTVCDATTFILGGKSHQPCTWFTPPVS